jgi:hypothetical protein
MQGSEYMGARTGAQRARMKNPRNADFFQSESQANLKTSPEALRPCARQREKSTL